jgi:hypothetical protein
VLADRIFYQAQIQKAQLNEFNLNEKLKELENEYNTVEEEENRGHEHVDKSFDYFSMIEKRLQQYSRFLTQKNQNLED